MLPPFSNDKKGSRENEKGAAFSEGVPGSPYIILLCK
jgi:hypothetical protein